jgi:hypothetical protein
LQRRSFAADIWADRSAHDWAITPALTFLVAAHLQNEIVKIDTRLRVCHLARIDRRL